MKLSRFPGYYKVSLDEDGILAAELTATPADRDFISILSLGSDSAHIILDMDAGIYNYNGKVLTVICHVVNDTLVTGYRITRGWARTRYIYFAMIFSKPFKSLWPRER